MKLYVKEEIGNSSMDSVGKEKVFLFVVVEKVR